MRGRWVPLCAPYVQSLIERERERERERLFSIACLGAKKQKKVKVVTCILKSNHKHNTESFYIFPLIFISQNLQCSHIHIITLSLSLSLSLTYSSITRFKWWHKRDKKYPKNLRFSSNLSIIFSSKIRLSQWLHNDIFCGTILQ